MTVMSATPMSAPSEQGIPFTRLVRIEIRKALDTRSGFWLGFVIAGLTVAILVAAAGGALGEATDAELFRNVHAPASGLLPFVTILMITSEFSARTALTTFVLVPNRWRVMAAKLLAALAMAAVVVGVIAAAAMLVGLVSPDHRDTLAGDQTMADAVWRAALQLAISVVSAFGFGLVLRNTPAAIVSFMLLPNFVSAALILIPGLEGSEPWIGQSALGKLTESDALNGTDWAQIASASAIWLVLPLVLGLWRLNRAEIK